MSVQQLPRPVVSGWVDAARTSIGSAASVPTELLGTDDLTDSLAAAAVLEAQVGAWKLALLAEADRRKIAESLAASGTDAWAAQLTGSTRAVMAGGIWLARLLHEKYALTREAFADGGINEDQVRVIVKAAEWLPRGVTEEQRRAAEAGLVARAVNGMNARGLRQAARRMAEAVSRELADQQEASLLTDEERRAERETWLTLRDNGDGTFAGRFVIPELHGQLLKTCLERLTSPRRLSRNRGGDLVHDDSVADRGELSWSERLGLGLTELIEHLPTDGFGANIATVVIHLDHQHLLDGLASAGLDAGARLSAGETRRLSCNAGLVPVVLGGASQVLDLGRSRRLHSWSQRLALSVHHDTCATEGCERPFAWCDVHHPHAWAHGGATDLDNALPLCGYHHRRAHDQRFDLDRLASGEVRFRRRR